MTDTTNAANSSPITAECAANMPNEWAPKRIWLQRGVGEGGSHTWCEDSQEPEHEEASYIREDFAGTLSTDYLSGHQDGLDWAALVVEYTDPRTGDWMYDDPHDLAKAIRKGPDMSVYQSAPSAPQQGGDGLRRDQEAAYNSIDRFLRNNLCDEDYAQYSAELYSLLAAPRQPGEMGAGDDTQVVLRWIMSQAESAKEPCGDDPESAAAVRNAKLAAIANAAAQALGLVRGPSYADAEAQCNPNDICAGCRCKYSMAASAQQDEREAKPLTRFVTYLNEHCIGQTITEESLTDWMLDVMDNTPREEPKHPQKSKGLFASSAQQVQADAGAVAKPVAFWNPAVDHDSAAFSYGQGGGYDVPLYTCSPNSERDAARWRMHVKILTRKYGAISVREEIDAIDHARAAMSREQSQEKGGERG
ncbi:hypothetical protein RN01_06925 [Cupriavidus sp. SHE]|jgi:hypothetical protein|uniref:hypothetical protein n=1 Tax=Cupriavidus TaxID=106589 RepID=UPI00046B73C7|nr:MULTISPECIES: hypothetical protein [Cupriavidus]KWR84486.1 hypothetical protein RN01_06925 [Cupriavidus sp. SHE]